MLAAWISHLPGEGKKEVSLLSFYWNGVRRSQALWKVRVSALVNDTVVTHSLLEAAGEVISGQTGIGGLVLAAIFTPPTRVVS